MRRVSMMGLFLVLGGCAVEVPPAGELPFQKVEPGKEDSSAEAIFIELSFDAELLTDRTWNPEQQIEDQLLYTIGQLNGDRGVSRLDRVELSDVELTETGDRYLVTYHAQIPVAWGRDGGDGTIPPEYTVILPRDMSTAALDAFADSYGHDCVDWGAHDVDRGSMWYYFRPGRSGCSLEPDDVVESVASVALSELDSAGHYPEYDMVWAPEADGSRVLRVVAVMGKFEDGATSNSDAGINAYNRFIRNVRDELADHDVTVAPEGVHESPGVEFPDVTITADLGDDRRVEVVVLLVDNVRTTTAEFDARYASLSGDADLIMYSGHAGLGANIRALARKGRWNAGQYAIVFMNGCDTYAYVDSALWDAHAEVNPDDPAGTRYLDIVMNALPAAAGSSPAALMALVGGLLSYDEPLTYESIFARIDRSQVVLVSGEQDNTYTPGGGGDPEPWDGMEQSGSLAGGEEVRFETPTLAAGSYRFEMSGTGDADLYVRVGSTPTTSVYDCRPYRSNSDEACSVELASSAPIHVMVRGYRDASFELSGGPH